MSDDPELEPLDPLPIPETPEEIINGLPEVARGWGKEFLAWLATDRTTPAPCWLDKFSHSMGIPFCTAIEKRLADASGVDWELWPHLSSQPWMTHEEIEGQRGYAPPPKEYGKWI